MIRKKRKDLLRRITILYLLFEALQGVDEILKEYPELNRKKHFIDLQDAVKETYLQTTTKQQTSISICLEL